MDSRFKAHMRYAHPPPIFDQFLTRPTARMWIVEMKVVDSVDHNQDLSSLVSYTIVAPVVTELSFPYSNNETVAKQMASWRMVRLGGLIELHLLW